MSLTVLSDEEVCLLLESLSSAEAEDFAYSLKCALHEYSTGTQGVDGALVEQPERAQVHSDTTGATTLFMPASSALGHGVKVMTVPSPTADPLLAPSQTTGSLTLYSPQGAPLGLLRAENLTAFRTALASSCLLQKRGNVRTLTVFGAGLQAYWHIRLALLLRGATVRTVYIINRSFSENARTILKKLHSTPTEVRRHEGWERAQFSLLTPGYGEYSRLMKDHVRAADVIYCCTPSAEPLFDASILTSHEGRRKGKLIVSVGGRGKKVRELPHELLLQAVKPQHGHVHYHRHAVEGGVVIVDTLDGALREAGEIIEAGLQPTQLVELGELAMINRLVKEEDLSSVDSPRSSFDSAADGPNHPGPHRSPSRDDEASLASSSSLSVDDRKGSGNGSSVFHFHLPSPFHHRRDSSSSSSDGRRKREDHLARWLSSGNVVYKSVGLGLMDLVVGLRVVQLARERQIGRHVGGFSPDAPEWPASVPEERTSAPS
ncbi:ornithine cyclodeaminase [Xylariaceae sp. FL0804]|nr:ornithine cyclodeaminase [Xylariaceae sp. FL0804]